MSLWDVMLGGGAHNAVTTAGPQLAAAVDRFLDNGDSGAIRPGRQWSGRFPRRLLIC
jgi:hypothetical protein